MTIIEIRPHPWGWKAFEAPGDGKRFVVRADEKLPGFIELECASRTRLRRLMAWHAKM